MDEVAYVAPCKKGGGVQWAIGDADATDWWGLHGLGSGWEGSAAAAQLCPTLFADAGGGPHARDPRLITVCFGYVAPVFLYDEAALEAPDAVPMSFPDLVNPPAGVSTAARLREAPAGSRNYTPSGCL